MNLETMGSKHESRDPHPHPPVDKKGTVVLRKVCLIGSQDGKTQCNQTNIPEPFGKIN